jgi:MYXO-CTERM domain-containing protein
MVIARQAWVGFVGSFAGLIISAAGCASTPDTGADPEVTGSSADAVTGAVGDWTGFTSGQCVHGVYQFYLHRYGISLTGTCAHATVGNCESCGACMIWEGPNVEPPAALFNKYAWGTTMPQTYDIVVYPPRTSAVGPGHVAAVDHMTSTNPAAWQNLYVMDTNYYGGETMATAVHTVSRAPYGIFRLKSLDVAPNAAPHGYLDAADCTTIAGWSQDKTSVDKAIFTDLYFGGPAGDKSAVGIRLLAGNPRSDLCTAIGSCNHGFSLATPRGAMDGVAHAVYAYGIDTTGGNNPLLADAPKTITCAAPAIAPTAVRRALTDAAALTNWNFNLYEDMASYTTAQLAAVANGPVLATTPKVVQVAGQPDIFVVDGAQKRKVSDTNSFAAWSFTNDEIAPILAADLAALEEGIAWPAAPLLVKDPTNATVYLLDDAVPATGAGAPPAGSANANGTNTSSSADNADSGGSSGCSASPRSGDAGAWLFAPLAALAFARRRRRA